MVAIAVSYLVMILAVAISSGYREELRQAISLLSGDIILDSPSRHYSSDAGPLSLDAEYVSKIRQINGVGAVEGAIYKAGIIKAGDNISGVMFKGVPQYDSLCVAIPASLADQLLLAQGDAMTAYFVGEKVRARKFKVKEIYGRGRGDDLYRTVLMGGNTTVVYAGLSDMQRLDGLAPDEVSSIEVRLEPSARESLDLLTQETAFVASSYISEDETIPIVASSKRRYPQIYSWLDLVDFNMLVLLVLMTIVAGFNMISGLLILLFRSTSTIGILKAMGMGNRAIAGIFLRLSSRHVLWGMAIGNAVALLFCLVQGTTHFIPLNPENYMLSYVPVHIDIPSILAADALSWLVIMLLLLVPCLFISRVDPAKTVKAE